MFQSCDNCYFAKRCEKDFPQYFKDEETKEKQGSNCWYWQDMNQDYDEH